LSVYTGLGVFPVYTFSQSQFDLFFFSSTQMFSANPSGLVSALPQAPVPRMNSTFFRYLGFFNAAVPVGELDPRFLMELGPPGAFFFLFRSLPPPLLAVSFFSGSRLSPPLFPASSGSQSSLTPPPDRAAPAGLLQDRTHRSCGLLSPMGKSCGVCFPPALLISLLFFRERMPPQVTNVSSVITNCDSSVFRGTPVFPAFPRLSVTSLCQRGPVFLSGFPPLSLDFVVRVFLFLLLPLFFYFSPSGCATPHQVGSPRAPHLDRSHS